MRVEGSLREAAAEALVRRQGGDARAAGRRFLEAAREHRIDLRNMWASVSAGGRVRQVCLAAPGAGRTATFFTSLARTDAEVEEQSAVIARAAAAAGEGLGQTLLDPTETVAARAYLGAGFMRLARLAYLSRALPASTHAPEADAEDWGAGVAVRAHDGDEAPLLRALERSYIDTMDCPALCRLRTPEDVLASHRATGVYDPSMWWVVRDAEGPEGAMLLSAVPATGHVELVYLGLGPRLRGRGLASRLLSFGMARAGARAEALGVREITCAVDLENAPALRLYERQGFRRIAEREALVRRLGEGTPGTRH